MITGKFYVGSTKRSLKERRNEHEKNGLRGRGHCILFVNTIHRYGVDAFDWHVLGIAYSEDDLEALESFWTDELQALAPNGYVLKRGNRGRMTNETRAKISASTKGRKHSREWNEKISRSLKGHEISNECREKISKTLSSRSQKYE